MKKIRKTKLTRQQRRFSYFVYFFGIVCIIILITDILTTKDLPIFAQILFWFGGISPIFVQWSFKAQNKAHRKIVMENRKKLFEEIPKEELFKEGTIFVDKFEGDEET